MSKTLVIAEKPSVAQDIVRALTPAHGKFEKHDDYFEGEKFIITSAVGHLVEIQAPEEYDVKRGKWSFTHLPVIPPHFDLKPVEKTKSRLNAVVKLAKRKDVTQLINACDAGREGELIFRLIEQYAAGVRGSLGKPIARLWLQSMTPQAIREGFEHLRSEQQMQGLADAARSRSEADWLVGINGTRAMTAFNSQGGGFFLTTVGRVQTPTLSIVVDRESKIRRFTSRDYWEIHAQFAAEAGTYSARWFDPQFKKGHDEHERADRIWDEKTAQQIAAECQGQKAQVSQESKPATQLAPLLFDLTSLQREANARFGFSAKTTLALAQSLYERHKALTYPRTDSRALPADYVGVARQTMAALAASAQHHLAGFAQQALDAGYVRANKRIFDDAKVSDHFAIIPTTQPPAGELSEAEQKLYDLVSRRFLAVFFPAAEYEVTTRISRIGAHHFKTEGKVLTQAGWLAIYGKEAFAEGSAAEGKPADGKTSSAQPLVAVRAGEQPLATEVAARALQTKPPARFSEATLLGAMEGAGKQIEDEELRFAMQDKGLGTPATRAAIIEGLLAEKYILREGRELIPTAKAFQLMTLLRGLGIEELSRAELTGQWEAKLAQMERGELSRTDFMRQIGTMTEKIVQKAKEFNRDSVPGDYATLDAPCPHCGGVVRENYRRFACVGTNPGDAATAENGCGFSLPKSPAGRMFEIAEVEALLKTRRIGPLDGFRSKAGWPFTAEIALVPDTEKNNLKLEFDFGDEEKNQNTTGENTSSESDAPFDFSTQTSLGPCPKCQSPVYAHGSNYVCSHSVGQNASCDFKSGQTILQQPIAPEQMQKLLATGRTDLLDKFVSNRTRRNFKAFLVWDASTAKVAFEFEQKGESKYPRKAYSKTSATPKATTTKSTSTKTSRKPQAAGFIPDADLAAIIGSEPISRPQALKKMWDYIKAHNLQDSADRRIIVADAKLRPIFGADRVGMFKITSLIGPHLKEQG